jgi:hypothetical protein
MALQSANRPRNLPLASTTSPCTSRPRRSTTRRKTTVTSRVSASLSAGAGVDKAEPHVPLAHGPAQ